MFHTIVSIKNDGHYFCRAGGNRPDGLNEPVTNDLDKARYFQQQLAKLSPLYTLEQPFFGVIKTAIKLSGLDISTAVMAPALPLSDDKVARVKAILEHIHQ
ncbi:hypothetical protein C6981_25235 [Escherichia coli]|nr:hypothetical protein C6981_25235 [Escherichia coli]